MRLPDDDSIELPDDDEGVYVIDRNEQPAPSLDELKRLVPGVFRNGDVLLRDAMLKAWGESENLTYAAGVRVMDEALSPRYADGPALSQWGALLGRNLRRDEDEAAHRARLLVPTDAVSPESIQAAVRALVAEVTSYPPAFLEPTVDAMFLTDGLVSFIGPGYPGDKLLNLNSNNDPASSTYDANQSNVDAAWSAFWAADQDLLLADYPDSVNPTAGCYIVKLWLDTTLAQPLDEDELHAEYGVWFAHFWVVLPGTAGDDSAVPIVAGSDWELPPTQPPGAGYFGYLKPDGTFDDVMFLDGLAGETTTNQTNIDPADTANIYVGYYPMRGDSLIERVQSEVDHRRGAGTTWVCFFDPALPRAV